MEYVNKAIRLVTSFLARIKGEIVSLIRKGVDKLVQLVLTKEAAAKDALGNVNTGPVNPNLGVKPFTPVTKRVSRLKPIFDLLNKLLEKLGCSIEDITDKLAQYLTDVLLGYLMSAFTAATCLVDTLVNGIINEILSKLDTLINEILGPIQELLGAAASSLNLIGSAINSVFSLLGISCDGPNSQCEKVSKECTNCGFDKKKDDWLDDLIAKIEDGPLEGTSVCAEATEYPKDNPTEAIAIGGIFQPSKSTNPSQVATTNLIQYKCSNISVVEGSDGSFVIQRTGNTTVSSSIEYQTVDGTAIEDQDFIAEISSGTIGFAPGEIQKTVTYKTLKDSQEESTEYFYITLSAGVTPTGMTADFPDGQKFKCEIEDSSIKNLGPDSPTYTPKDPIDSLNPKKPIPTVPPSNTSTQPIVEKTTRLSPIPTVKAYSVVTDKFFYQEGEKITYTITTENVADETVLSYTLSGPRITEADIYQGLTGEFTIINNTATVVLDVSSNEDNGDTEIPDENEDLFFSIDDTNVTTTVVILGFGSDDPAYSVVADKLTVDEGDSVIYTINTLNVQDNTVLNYTLSGDYISGDDIVGSLLTGSFTVVNNTATVEVGIAADTLLEDAELLTFTIDDTDAFINIIINAQGEDIVDAVSPGYAVVSDKLEYSEGDTITYTVNTTNIPDGTVLQYSLIGSGINPSDFVSNSLYGSFVILDSTAKIYISIADDAVIEESETVTFVINGTNASTDVIILGQTTPDTPNTPIEILKPCIDPPTLGTPITDGKGKIISIPIIDKGCPYQQPPRIIITGDGYGGSGLPLLDKDGRVSEIRVISSGVGYKVNDSDNLNLSCVIDSFTIISPGRGYITEPDVYIDGIPGLARATINENGFVNSVQILDRVSTYKELPKITIQGGSGSGARVVPSLTCLDIRELEINGYVKIGTGKYIDCP
jgi:hypothetical protein